MDSREKEIAETRRRALGELVNCEPRGCLPATTDAGAPVYVRLTDELINKVLSNLRERGKAESRWDINKLEGELAERSLLKLLSSNGTTVEVKRDFKSAKTGNIAVEEFAYGKPSGIAVTQAEWWAYMLDGKGYDGEVVVLIKTSRLRKLISQLNLVKAGDNLVASIKLLPIFRLLQRL